MSALIKYASTRQTASKIIHKFVQAFLLHTLAWLLVVIFARSDLTIGHATSLINLENANCQIQFDPANGSVILLVDKDGGHVIQPPANLANSFSLVVRDATREEFHLISGKQQRVGSVDTSTGELEISWQCPLASTEEHHFDISASMKVRLSENGVEFRLALQNASPHVITEVRYPIISGLSEAGGQTKNGSGSVFLPTTTPSVRKLDFPFGVNEFSYPGQLCMSFADITIPGANRSMYLASHDPVARLKVYSFTETTEGNQKDILASINYCPHVEPSSRFDGPPSFIRFHSGGWREAGRIYRDWFNKTFGLMNPDRDWIRRESFFQDTMFLLPEGNINYTFHDIPQWAREARDYGVTSVMISGWHRGGHDNGYPYYTPDPRLGDYEDLKAGIAACHDLGVKVYFFANYQTVMMDSKVYNQSLYNMVECNRGGFPYAIGGFGMGTLAARMGYTTPLMTKIDPHFKEYQDLLIGQFLKLVEIGADGLHIDKMFPSSMNFNPLCTASPDVSPWEGAIQLTDRIINECKKLNPSFAMSFECNWDRLLQYANAVWWGGYMTIVKDVFPELAETVSITQPYDYMGVNNAVREGQVILLGPNNYTRSIGLTSWKHMSRYIKEVKRLQDMCSNMIFLGERLEKETVVIGRSSGESGLSVWRDRETGKIGVVLTSVSSQDIRVQEISGKTGSHFQVYLPFEQPHDITLPTDIKLPSQGLAFIVEQ